MQQLQSFLAVALIRLGFAGISFIASCSRWVRDRNRFWEPSEA